MDIIGDFYAGLDDLKLMAEKLIALAEKGKQAGANLEDMPGAEHEIRYCMNHTALLADAIQRRWGSNSQPIISGQHPSWPR